MEACETVADKLGFDKGGVGFTFQGDYGTKGCYAYNSGKYKGHVYYGNGGTDAQMKESLDGDKFRPKGYDCADQGTTGKVKYKHEFYTDILQTVVI